jgi:hypothetical protein
MENIPEREEENWGGFSMIRVGRESRTEVDELDKPR